MFFLCRKVGDKKRGGGYQQEKNGQHIPHVDHRQKEELFSVLHGEDFSAQAYRDSFARFKRSVQEREREYINLTAYFVFRYFMKAAYDHDVYGKAQLITANYLVLQEMDFLRWIQNGEKYGFKDRMELIHIFSREVEYSEENVEEILQQEVGKVFCEVLEDAGVYKCNEKGLEAFHRFVGVL